MGTLNGSLIRILKLGLKFKAGSLLRASGQLPYCRKYLERKVAQKMKKTAIGTEAEHKDFNTPAWYGASSCQ